MMNLPLITVLASLHDSKCPCCRGTLHRDEQRDSIYVNCHHCGTFEFAGFRDFDTGKMVLAYLNKDAQEGAVDPDVLRALEMVLFRRTY